MEDYPRKDEKGRMREMTRGPWPIDIRIKETNFQTSLPKKKSNIDSSCRFTNTT
jgi:hypothetical protein